MRAAQFDHYGGPEVLQVAQAPIPGAAAGQVLVAVRATSVNRLDTVVRSGHTRIATGFRFPQGTGVDFAGEVIGFGERVTGVAIGDRVWGALPGLRRGMSAAAADVVVVRREHLSAAPSRIETADAASLPLVALTALTALRRHLKLRPGVRLLVRGAGGGVGTAAVQLGKAMGAHVTALTSADTLDLVRRLGADAALDYRTHGPSQLEKFDAVLDLTGTHLAAYRALLAPRGRMVTTAARGVPYILFSVVHGPKRVRAFTVASKADLLVELAGFVDDGVLTPVIHRTFPLEEIAAAHRAFEQGGVAGKLVVTVP